MNELEVLQEILVTNQQTHELLLELTTVVGYILGILIFVLVVMLCKYSYSWLSMFFK